MKIKKRITNRGFDISEFKDTYGKKCSIQKSSLASKDAIWVGISEPIAQIMTPTGWANYELPDGIFIPTRMHLTQGMVAKILPALIKFVETGDI
jgi:hypothetical protein